ncbi:MAG: D-tyrosyl-tRNA(Tyr) deacylase [Chlorobium sp.]|uniref:D-aminoacyl-tRNA deacylase n=1 Tax=Chlorobium sp. TaxID=1095 RepID=UPI0025BECE80|nr:D-aminoacyl-tRNA deacylase [Chlorobium sp.]MCF8216098.1 D-tyrosyl-tRNA(Tyr) deacylase [Chlorobium sp.]MCF8270999.1 D-tyrosyl-tRNA(Tyr) deacylase [Chlorobium sp.]MCF8287355.1 D-tyrosyl-tRNA(Tyr) deacylase [Chlorobium sp.]MCF8290912.1 D-tyrosyl-tRNA(Tyr) deacylase [Chlorobium sp.]MCF8385007.1 D-tyrosyl-tRNA(Tyr) deacylase [Chlorobium sp.]
MRAVAQRVVSASVTADGGRCSQIGPGLLVLLGIAPGDGAADAEWMSRKLVQLRIFDDCDGKMNLSLRDTGGGMLLVSQFTLYGDSSRGNRPGFSGAAGFTEARPVFQAVHRLSEHFLGRPVGCGWYGETMQVSLVNDGPVTLILDTPQR